MDGAKYQVSKFCVVARGRSRFNLRTDGQLARESGSGVEEGNGMGPGVAGGEGAAGGGKVGTAGGGGEEFAEGAGEGGGIGGVDEEGVAAGVDGIRDAAGAMGHHRQPGGGGLEADEAETLDTGGMGDAGQDEEGGGAEEPGAQGVIGSGDELHVETGLAGEGGTGAEIARVDERSGAPHFDVGAFGGGEGGEGLEEGELAFAGMATGEAEEVGPTGADFGPGKKGGGGGGRRGGSGEADDAAGGVGEGGEEALLHP